MKHEPPVTFVGTALHRRWRLKSPLYLLLAVVVLLGLAATVLGVILLWQVTQNRTPRHADVVEHFKYGSIGAEPNSGIPYRIWKALPRLFPEAFGNRDDYAAFGFLYEAGSDGGPRDLPVGISRRVYRGVEVVWFNCATCHTGTVRQEAGGERQIVPAMPSNNLDLHRFVGFLLDAGADERLSAARLIPAMNDTGERLGPIETAVYRWYVIPLLREGLVLRRSRLGPLLAGQPAWGPGRVDTFNPYKLIQANMPLSELDPKERIGTADFPAIFEQGPRDKMHLHWDGNNTSLAERNLSAAMGAGVTPETVEHDAIERVAEWLKGLRAPPSPHRPTARAVLSGREIYQRECAGCHGAHYPRGYVFTGERIGQVEPQHVVGTDPHRLDSYTQRLRDYQRAEFFKGTEYHFKNFDKTDGYANLPLDGLWLRAPYLHNGSVPTLADLLEPPARRPKAFVRGSDVIDRARGGFVAPACDPAAASSAPGFCYDTSQPGNRNDGHLYGTDLPAAAKSDLLGYLLTF